MIKRGRFTKKRVGIAFVGLMSLCALIVGVEFVYIQHNGKTVAAPLIPRDIQLLGKSGSPIKYVVMGDSTSIGQGTQYEHSYAYQSALHLAKDHQVSLINVGISNARVQGVVNKQLAKAVAQKPDIVLLAIGANDVTHFTSQKSFETSLQTTINGLRSNNCGVKIVVTGSPAMGSVARFPIGARQLASYRTNQINRIYKKLITRNNLTLAPVADRTGKAFADDPSLFAQDKFHPNARGYALWTPVINNALDTALAGQPNNCLL